MFSVATTDLWVTHTQHLDQHGLTQVTVRVSVHNPWFESQN